MVRRLEEDTPNEGQPLKFIEPVIHAMVYDPTTGVAKQLHFDIVSHVNELDELHHSGTGH